MFSAAGKNALDKSSYMIDTIYHDRPQGIDFI